MHDDYQISLIYYSILGALLSSPKSKYVLILSSFSLILKASSKDSPFRDGLWYDDDIGDAGDREPQAGAKHSVEPGVLVELSAHELHEGEEHYADSREHSVERRSLTEN